MKKIIKVTAPLILVGAGLACLYKKNREKTMSQSPAIVIIPGNDPAFDPTMYNVLLLKRINSNNRLAIIKVLRLYTGCELSAIKDLTDHGGYVCGLSTERMAVLKEELEKMEAIVEIRQEPV